MIRWASDMDAIQKELYEERVAIMIHGGGMPLEEAERLAHEQFECGR